MATVTPLREFSTAPPPSDRGIPLDEWLAHVWRECTKGHLSPKVLEVTQTGADLLQYDNRVSCPVCRNNEHLATVVVSRTKLLAEMREPKAVPLTGKYWIDMRPSERRQSRI